MAESMIRRVDGTFSMSHGVQGGQVTAVESSQNPDGIPRNMLAWLNNATVRGGGVTQRDTWQRLCDVHEGDQLYQGGWVYYPAGDADPHLILSIGGHIYRVNVQSDNSVEDLTANQPVDACGRATANPSTPTRVFYAQGEEFLVIQPGDYDPPNNPGTLPLFYDGVLLRRSNGLTGQLGNVPCSINEIPAAGPMDYYMGHIWYGQQRILTAGDTVRNQASGDASYNYRNSILRVTENPLAIGGDGFTVPNNAGTIRAIKSVAELDQAVGQGNLYVGTRKAIYRMQVPVTRQAWIAADANNQPLLTVVQKKYGFINDRSLVEHNSDLFYKAMDGTRSLALAVRYFQQWGNTAISKNEDRLMQFNDRALMQYASGVEFDNRILHTELPYQTPCGPAFRALSPLDLDLITTLEEKLPPAWEGMYEGLDLLQILEGDFGGLQRCFGIARSTVTGAIEVWEMQLGGRFENGDSRVTWYVEWPAFTWNRDFLRKKLDGADIWIDRLAGTVDFRMQYRTDCDLRWRDWAVWQDCECRDECEDPALQICPPPSYPTIIYGEGCRAIKTLGSPPAGCMSAMGRPSNVGYQFQPRLIIKGWCRIRGILLYSLDVDKSPGEGIVC